MSKHYATTAEGSGFTFTWSPTELAAPVNVLWDHDETVWTPTPFQSVNFNSAKRAASAVAEYFAHTEEPDERTIVEVVQVEE